ncbi:MAG: SUMF1/EgtB/PvdO family nonheme iron enzyme [Bacteroidota bacterium]|jgi:gliding motility-associated lipoprotein GldJ|uniref:SUMF1/EgtB/PvdO family nonheme iron enzyme n=1 Tax=Candidatus Pollutiaquabacter sp. TaxID=3416354 RepID=UPI001A43ACBD|nr:SUMF1/EgtB/PvdO family nonheme iron enzyme [Bacteroidota bacterium]MBL7948927.1 SUMF1/EgtB/PvdO family nonheme iron enzyme [Bacteroidia bacterium]MBP6010519.1 SUMF1/EgtB/PvdO family nonheme iron enzyme [Bacteroidia bacterium]MBP7270934.1 SUMF1/EgtB/PvdO family nonheme iron enzyme [Bacteroidia bacterium]MBP7436790.1 SUMF1/EgtB/PvdO family nonheme iron enzyme [Bacteroidia bacterium]
MKNLIRSSIGLVAGALLLTSCGKEKSSVTGWNYNDPKNGGFEVVPYDEQETGPGLVLVEGGTFTMGRTEQDVTIDWNNIPRRVTVSSFYMDETEVANIHYLEYLYWTSRVFSADYPEVYKKALPDTLVWRDKVGYNEPMIELYLRHPAYQQYPVVGVNWLQANDFCNWRTDRVNEQILIREGILRVNPNQINEDNFNSDSYLAGQYEGLVKSDLMDLNPSSGSNGTRKVRMEDGILLPRYRLPTEAEWEYAALSQIGNTVYERVTDRRQYPWNGHIVRNKDEKYKGQMMANYKRGRGDQMGTAGFLNDNADRPAPVQSYWPNDFGLYCMAGNVNEWVMDVYRPLSPEDKADFNPYRGNVFKTQIRDEEGTIVEKDSLGRVPMRDVTEEENVDRRNYTKADNINYLDADEAEYIKYDYGATSMVNDKARVYKGGSWKDRAYWMSPGTRRFLDENQSTDDIGFRCAMVRVGSPVGLGAKPKTKLKR